jgi:hypothetical protein
MEMFQYIKHGKRLFLECKTSVPFPDVSHVNFYVDKHVICSYRHCKAQNIHLK